VAGRPALDPQLLISLWIYAYSEGVSSASVAGRGQEESDRRKAGRRLSAEDGSPGLTADEIWRTYMLLTRVQAAFRAMKSPLMERPIFHQLEKRTQTHIFLCVLAYYLLVAIEKCFLDGGVHTSWWILRQQLSTHQVVTMVSAHPGGEMPEDAHRDQPGPYSQADLLDAQNSPWR
jgi:hypothetical protein